MGSESGILRDHDLKDCFKNPHFVNANAVVAIPARSVLKQIIYIVPRSSALVVPLKHST